jgi:outer membrane receptor for ferric coprogen and ferric-rhodotorulic acid
LPHYVFTSSVTLSLCAYTVQQAQAQELVFNIPSQPLGEAIQAYGEKTNIQILYSSEDIQNKRSNAIAGSYNPEQAMAILLINTGISFSISDNTITIYSDNTSKSSLKLDAINVTSMSARDEAATEGTGSYTQSGPSSTATGLALTLRETPQSITVITRQKMDDFNQQTLKDALNSTPGITVTQNADWVRFYSRGGEVENFQIDGGRNQSTLSTGLPSSSNLVDDDMATIDRIEILKGSAGLLQGDGNPTATINMIRKKPTHEFQASVGASAGSWDTYRTDVDVSGPLTQDGNIRGRSVLAYTDANSWKDRLKKRNSLFYGTLEFDITPSTLINIGVDYKERKNQGLSGSYGAGAYDSSGNFIGWTSRSWSGGPSWAGYEQNILSSFLTLEHRFANNWDAKLYLNNEKSETPDWINANLSMPGTGANLGRYKDVESRTKNVNLELKGTFSLFGRTHDLLFGGDFTRNNYKMDQWRGPADYRATTLIDYQDSLSATVYTADGGKYYPNPGKDNWDIRYLYRSNNIRRGAYFSSRLNLHDNLKFIIGTRISDYIYRYTRRNVYQGANELLGESRVTETGVVTPYAGLVYDLNKNLSLYASYANIFQPVTAQDEQGKTLTPQEGVTYEIGSKAELYDGRLNASFAYFWKRWENTYEESGGTTPTGDTAYRNVNGVMEHGYELEISGEIVSGVQVQGSYVLNNSELETSSGIPKHQFKVNGTYQLPGKLDNFTVGAGFRWQSEINTYIETSQLEQKAYWLTDVMARYKITRNLTAGLNINNLFDKKYFSGVTNIPGQGEYYTWGEPRNLTANIRYNF